MITYSELPFDVIHYLTLALFELDRKALCEFSCVDKRTRDVCIPVLFERIVFNQSWGQNAIPWVGAPEAIRSILKSEAVVEAIK